MMLNMRSAHSSSEDLTARARIRDAAIVLIGRHGFDRTSMRMIAEAAGVSPALVVHHFGDKSGLRAACDAHVVAAFTVDEHGVSTSATIEVIQAALGDVDAYGPELDYLARMLAEDSAAADELFDGILQGTLATMRDQQERGVIRPQRDPESSALLLAVFGLVPLLMRRQFARALGEERLTPAVFTRITLPMLELLTHGLYADDAILRATEAALAPPADAPPSQDRT